MRVASFRLRTKIGIALLVPLLVAVVIAGYEIVLNWRARSEMAKLAADAAGAAEVSRLVHELQRERGTSAVFIGSKGAQFRAELPAQRKLTDERRRSAVDFLAALGATATSDEDKAAIAAASDAVAAL